MPEQQAKYPNYACRDCKDTGLKYEGNGHRMAGYPWAEGHVSVACTCKKGRELSVPDDSVAKERAAQETADRLMQEREHGHEDTYY